MRRAVAGGLRMARHPIGLNALSLYGVQFANLLAPLITLPYLSRTLGPTEFGVVAYAQGFGLLTSLVIDFSLEYSGSRAAASVRDDPRALSRLAADVIGARTILITLSAALATVLVIGIPSMRAHPGFFALAWVGAAATGLSPGWYFVGIERLRLVSLVQLTLRLLGAGLTFLMVRDKGDAWYVLYLYAATSVSSCLLTNGLLYRDVQPQRPDWTRSRRLLREARTLFVGTTAIALYSSTTVVLLGLVAAPAVVARYAAADRIIRASLGLLGPVTLAVFPRLAYLHSRDEQDQARRLTYLTMGVLGGFGVLAAAGLAIVAGPLVRIVYGEEFGSAAAILRLLALLLPILAIAQTLAGGWMMAARLDRQIVRAVVRAALTILVIGIPMGALWDGTGMALAVVLSELVALGGCVAAVRRHDRTLEQPLLRFRPSVAGG